MASPKVPPIFAPQTKATATVAYAKPAQETRPAATVALFTSEGCCNYSSASASSSSASGTYA